MDEIALQRHATKLAINERRFQLALKRAMDVSLSLAALMIFSPVFLLIAIAVRIDTPGPVIFKHRRIGKHGRPFDLYKFRSMAVGGDDHGYLRYLQELIESSKNGGGKPYRKMSEDPRVTRVGRLLRNYYLDELPQLWNILKGDMSLVGPRPHVQLEVDHYTPEQRRRLLVRPGATGLWQVQGKGDCTFDELLALDIQYVETWSLALDLKLIWQTVYLILGGGEGLWARMHKAAPRTPSEATSAHAEARALAADKLPQEVIGD